MLEITCYGELEPGISQEDAAKWMQGKPVRQCISKKQNLVLGAITLAEPYEKNQMKVTVVITNKEACEEFSKIDTFLIRSCNI